MTATDEQIRDSRTRFMTLKELAEVFGITTQTAGRMAEKDELPVRSFRLGRQWRFSRAEVDALFGDQHQQTES